MLIDTIARVNELRQKALSEPIFLQSAIEHEKAIQNVEIMTVFDKKRKSLADIYGGHSEGFDK
ncbi:hypothetical protein [Aliivibrio fischeri]|uniref:Uncharacterized protein n=1 Tax=Aliivibrio fischeri TaxID=668 RepID=A0A510UTL3_ALIFS|nr:hypothetical protein [Aliivibrio fischeri]GEK16165.1 hypothetical protein AFI02nite_42010 [Aliivibrio fischeri]